MSIESTEEQVKSMQALEALLDSLKVVLPGLPGFRSLSLFGSLAEGRADAYSDIDLIVATDDLSRAKLEVMGLLEQLGPIEFCWVMSLRSDEWNPTIVFSNEGYYHKLDLGLVGSTIVNRTIPVEQTVLLTEKPVIAVTGIQSGMIYTPEYGSIGHFLFGHFIGASRYMKARKRGQPITCFRFATAQSTWCASLLYSRLTDNSTSISTLSTERYKALDKLASDEQRSAFLQCVDFSTPASMDRGMYSLICMLVDDARALAGKTGEVFPDDIIHRFLQFARRELIVDE
ncbi:MAG: nucleotidyltransferase domain-containing protein [Armatimonadota bacterium]